MVFRALQGFYKRPPARKDKSGLEMTSRMCKCVYEEELHEHISNNAGNINLIIVRECKIWIEIRKGIATGGGLLWEGLSCSRLWGLRVCACESAPGWPLFQCSLRS